MAISEERADRIELKVDNLISAVNRLAVIDERQIEAGKRMGQVEDRIAKIEEGHKKDMEATRDKIHILDARVNKWINMGIGAWAVAVTMYSLYINYSR